MEHTRQRAHSHTSAGICHIETRELMGQYDSTALSQMSFLKLRTLCRGSQEAKKSAQNGNGLQGTQRGPRPQPNIFFYHGGPSAGFARNPCLKTKLRKICAGQIISRKIDSRKMSAFCILHSLQRNEWHKRLQRLFCIFLQ